jgi:hypothetical protein
LPNDLPKQPDERPRGRARDIIWLTVAAFLVLLFVVDLVESVIAIAQRDWTNVAGAPAALLFFWWTARGAWRRTSWGARRRQAKDATRTSPSRWRVDMRGFMLFLPNGYESYRRRADADVLVALRSIIVMFSIVLFVFAMTLATFPDLPNGAVVPWVPLLAALAASSLNAARLVTTQPLDCSSDDALATAYIPVVCLRLALAGSIALFGLTFTLLGGPAWTYYPAALCSLIWLWTGVAPTRRTLARDQRRMSGQGCDRSLTGALGPRPRTPA